MQQVIERHVTAGPDLQQKLAASRAGAQGEILCEPYFRPQ